MPAEGAARDLARELRRAGPRRLPSDTRAALSRVGDEASRTGVNRGQEKRRVDRDAELTLAAPADEVPDVTNQVIDVTEGANGVVLNSRVTGTDENARATLELQVPSATLDDTLAQLSELADVKSRTEQAIDITRIYVSAKDRLVGLRAQRDNLATRIRAATTDAEVASLTGSARRGEPADRRREERARRGHQPRPALDRDRRGHLRGRAGRRR